MSRTASQPAITHASLGFLVLACALGTFPPVTSDIYLPALPRLTAALMGTPAEGQRTLAAYFVGVGLGQLFYGPTADRIGRRPVMLFGAVLYLLATLGCYFSTSIGQMIALRFVQALGACAGLVISATIVRDRFAHQESARILSMLMTARSLGPMLAPMIGGAIVTLLDWRAIFAALGLFGTVMLIAIMFGMEETRTEAVAARARTESPLRAYLAAVSNPQVLGYVLTNGLIYAGLFAWITAAPYLIITKYKVPPFWFGWIFGALALGITLSAQANRRLLRRHPADRLMRRGALVAVAAGILLFAAAASGTGGLLGILIPLFFVLAMLGFVATNAVAGGLAADPSRAGTISALTGSTQFGLAAIASSLMGFVSHDPAIAMGIVIPLCVLGSAIYPLRLALGRLPGKA